MHALFYIDELRCIGVRRQQEASVVNGMTDNYNSSALKLLIILVPNLSDTSL